MGEQLHRPARRVIVGVDDTGASTVVSDTASPQTLLSSGILLQEVWQQRSLPATTQDQPLPGWTLGPAAPTEGAVVRILTFPPGGEDLPTEPDLHSDASLHVITMLNGELDVVLQKGRVTLRAGETIVLRDSLHDLSNRRGESARFVYTSFPLADGPSGGD